MKDKTHNSLGPIRKINFIIVAAILLILVCFTLLHYSNGHRELEDKLIINVFGKQRMYTQMMSKDVGRLYILLQSEGDNSSKVSKDEMDQEITQIRDSLTAASKEFSAALTGIHDRHLTVDSYSVHINDAAVKQSDYLEKIDTLWLDFDQAVQVVINSKQADSNMIQAVTYINDNNMELLDLSDKLLDQLLQYSLRSDRNMEYMTYTLIGLAFIIVVISLIHLQRYIIQPYNELYKGITDIGLNTVKPYLPTRKKVMPLVAEVSDVFLKINYLISLIENINNQDSFMETLEYINNRFSSFIPYNYIGIALITPDKKRLRASYGVSDGSIVGLPDKILGTSWAVSDTSLEKLLVSGEARIINDLEKYCEGRPIKPYNQELLEAGVKASIALPLIVSGEPVGMIFFSSRNKNVYNEGHLNFLSTLANSIAISFNKNIFSSEILYSSILALAKLSEARDEDTGEHMERMAKYSKAITQLLYENDTYAEEINIEYVDLIERFSPLHDIGKVGIVDGILLKPGKLTPEEFTEMKKHTLFGAEVLKAADHNLQKRGKSQFGLGIEIAEGHHEKWDGSGYPYGKKEQEIPISARIVAIADVFDALTSKRPYKEPFSLEKAYSIISEGRGTHFDPAIIDTFFENKDRIEEIYYMYKHKNLSNNQ